MVTIPNSDGVYHPISQPETPRRHGDVGRFLKRLNLEHDLNLPWNDRDSRNKRRKSPGHDVAKAAAFLYYQDPGALDQAYEEFRRHLPDLPSEEQKINFLLERLNLAKTSCLKGRTPRSRNRSPPERDTKRSAGPPEPASPTLSVKHAPPNIFEMPAGENFQLPPSNGFRESSLKRPRSMQSLTDKLKSSSSGTERFRAAPTNGSLSGCITRNAATENMPRLFGTSSAQKPGYTSVNTSFTSVGQTSANTSFWSDAHQGTQDSPPSSATTNESFHTPPNPSQERRAAALEYNGANDKDRIGTHLSDYYGSSPYLEDIGQGLVDHYRQSTQKSEFGGLDASQGDLDRIQQQADVCGRNVAPRPPEARRSKTDYTAETSHPVDRRPDDADQRRQGRIKQIPEEGLSRIVMPRSFLQLPFDLRLEAIRALHSSDMSPADFDASWSFPRTRESLHKFSCDQKITYDRSFVTDFTDHSLAAELNWSGQAQGRVFDLQPFPPRKDKSSAFERKFGRDRFLTVDLPSLHRSPPDSVDLDKCQSLVREQVKELFKREQRYAGRIWRQFLVQPKKAKRSGKEPIKGALQVTFFAVRSEENAVDRLEEIGIDRLLNWAVQFDPNTESPQCKMYSRLDLAASRTIPTLVFKRNEIVMCDDQMPTNDPDNMEFHDHLLTPNTTKSTEAMNDGCNRISTWAMRKIQEALGLPHLPSVVQGRIFGAKGIWYPDDEDADLDERPEKLIWISKSQVKVKQSDAEYYDPDKVVYNVVKASGQPYHSFLYQDFLPIMENRHVPRSSIERKARESTRAIAEDFIKAFPDRITLAEWINRQNAVRQGRTRSNGIDAVGGFPTSREEQILQMLAAGFEPTMCKYLADEAKATFEQYLDWIRSDFKIELRNSTMLYGIADPYGVLEPGQIHVGFSKPFEDATQTRHNLRKLEALVSLLPSLGRPDMQRVKCVFKEELSHLTDVVVFPSRGPRSLASKLQGGDYDGDTFVVIWEQSLVKHFRNAPVPIAEKEPSHFGITVDDEKMGKAVPAYFTNGFKEWQVLEWIAYNTSKRMEYDRLGSITLMYEKIVYHDNRLDSPRAIETLRLHDLMIDAAKQGYTLSKDAWDAFKERHGLKKLDSLGKPAWRRFTEGSGTNDKNTRSAAANAKNTQNISDYIFFDVIEPALAEAKERVEVIAADATADDQDLGSVYYDMLKSLGKGSPARKELRALDDKIDDPRQLYNKLGGLKQRWGERMARYFNKIQPDTRDWRTVVSEVRADFESIMPDDTSSETVHQWRYRIGSKPTTWDLLKASCLVVVNERTKTERTKNERTKSPSAKWLFCAAGYELCFIKAFAKGHAVPVRADAYCNLEHRRKKRKIDEVVGDGEEETEGDADGHESGG